MYDQHVHGRYFSTAEDELISAVTDHVLQELRYHPIMTEGAFLHKVGGMARRGLSLIPYIRPKKNLFERIHEYEVRVQATKPGSDAHWLARRSLQELHRKLELEQLELEQKQFEQHRQERN
jgi:hypothetical protein